MQCEAALAATVPELAGPEASGRSVVAPSDKRARIGFFMPDRDARLPL